MVRHTPSHMMFISTVSRFMYDTSVLMFVSCSDDFLPSEDDFLSPGKPVS